MNDQELVSRLPHSEVAFTEVYNRYWDKLLYVAGLKLQNTTIAEEIVQDVFVDFWNRRMQLQIHTSLEAYLAVAVKYRIINAQLRIKREQDFRQNGPQIATVADQSLDEKELYLQFQKLIDRLPEKCRITYRLSREEGLSLRQISLTMAVSQKAVEANLTRSLKLLRFGLRKIMFSTLLVLLAILKLINPG